MNDNIIELIRQSARIIKEHCQGTDCYSCPFYVSTGYHLLGREEKGCEFKSIYTDGEEPCDWRIK